MRNDFLPVHLMNANAKLDRHPLMPKTVKKKDRKGKDKSLWHKFVGFFKDTF